MALALLSHAVADLTLGKPALSWLACSTSVRDALAALKFLGNDISEISIWDCSCSVCPSQPAASGYDYGSTGLLHSRCRCVGKICMQMLICYLASDDSLANLGNALDAPVSSLLADNCSSTVQHVDPEASVLEALELIKEGAQNLVIPIMGRAAKHVQHYKASMLPKHAFASNRLTTANISIKKDHKGLEYCWLTQEDVLRYLLGSIGVFSPLPMMSINELGIIRTSVRMVGVKEDAIAGLDKIKEACRDMTAVAVVEIMEGKPQLVGDISSSVLQACDETAALALATLSAGDFLVYTQHFQNSPDVLVDLICTRINDKLGEVKGDEHRMPLSKVIDANHLLHDLEMWEASSSEDDESGAESPSGPHDLSHKWHSAHLRLGGKGHIARSQSGPIFCSPESSLVAVLLQALAHREHIVWVTSEDDSLQGMVTLSDILSVMLSYINGF